MRSAYTVEQVRAAEGRAFAALGHDPAGPESLADVGSLMQRASAGLANAALDALSSGGIHGAPVLLVCGAGNNGGDGLFAAARLARRGVVVSVVGENLHPDGWAALRAAGGRRIEHGAAVESLAAGRVRLVLDALFGIGGRAGLPKPAAELAEACWSAGVDVLAVDLPSGMDADSVRTEGNFPATSTVTFGGYKICHLAQPASAACGPVRLVRLGLELDAPALRAWDDLDVAKRLPIPGATSQKYSRGVLGLDVGSADYPGAAVMAHLGAAHTGIGMLRCLGSAEVAKAVIERLPNVVAADGRVQARLLGSGWGSRSDAAETLRAALDSGDPLVLDADALAALDEPVSQPCLLTPHAGELARLLGVSRDEVESDPLGHVRRAADQTGAAVLLKGASQFVASPGSPTVELAVPGPAWTGQAGSGDVLAGVCGALLAGGLSPTHAGVVGASLQAITARENPGPWPPQELAGKIPAIVARLAALNQSGGVAARRRLG